MNAPTKSQPPAMQAMLDEMLRIAGDDAHRPGVMEQLAEVMKKPSQIRSCWPPWAPRPARIPTSTAA